MKIKEQIVEWKKELTNCLAITEKYYLEVKELKDSVAKLVEINTEMSECILALLKQQLGD